MKHTEISIQVSEIIGHIHAVEAEEGQKVYEFIKTKITDNQRVRLSFLDIDLKTTAFLNTAIGQLLKDFSKAQIEEFLTVENLSNSGIAMLKRVVDTANLYYNDPENFRRMQESIQEILTHH